VFGHPALCVANTLGIDTTILSDLEAAETIKRSRPGKEPRLIFAIGKHNRDTTVRNNFRCPSLDFSPLLRWAVVVSVQKNKYPSARACLVSGKPKHSPELRVVMEKAIPAYTKRPCDRDSSFGR